jgi:ABC-type lipoprotein release transport system permease subunit
VSPVTRSGIVLGVAAATLLTPVMSAILYGVGPMDVVTYAGVSIALAGVSLLATYLPARRAPRVHPVITLRARVSPARTALR